MGTTIEIEIDPKIRSNVALATAVESVNDYFRRKAPATQNRLSVVWQFQDSPKQLNLKLTGSRKPQPDNPVTVEQLIPLADMSNPQLRDVWGIHTWGDLLEVEAGLATERLKWILAQSDEEPQNGN